jgi:predicted nucleic acid-binding protein
MAGVGVTIDADCLYSAPVRDTLLRLTDAGLYRVYWSHEILEEALRNLRLNGAMTDRQAEHLRSALREAFPEAFVTGHRRLMVSLTCAPEDRHVLAVAIRSGSRILVTNNVRDYPVASVTPFSIEVQTPDAFLCDVLASHPELVWRVLAEQAAALRNPPLTVQQLLDLLANLTPAFAGAVRAQLGLTGPPAD